MIRRLLAILERANPSCRSAMRTVSESMDRPLTRPERLAIAAHMLHCPACSRARNQITLMVQGLRRFSRLRGTGPLPRLPDEVRERIKRTLRDG